MFSQPVAGRIVGDRLSPNGQKQVCKAYRESLILGEQLLWLEKRIRSNGHWLSDDPAVRVFDLQFYALYASCWWELEDPHSAAFLENPKAAKLAKEKGLKTEKLGLARTPEAKLSELAEAYGGKVDRFADFRTDILGGPPPPTKYQLMQADPNFHMRQIPGWTEVDLAAAEDGERTTVWYHGKTYQKQSTNQSEEETIMKATASLNIRTITFIGSQPADQYTDEAIYSLIAESEAAITHFQAMKNQPERLKVSLTSIQKEIDELVKIVDARV